MAFSADFCPVTEQISSVSTEKVDNWEFGELKVVPTAWFCYDSAHFIHLESCRAYAVNDLFSQIVDPFIHSFIKSSFFNKNVFCLYTKQNNTLLLLDVEFAVLTRELPSWTLKEKFHIYVRPCIILYLIHEM